MIEYLLIISTYTIGCYFAALEVINKIRKRNLSATLNEVKKAYLQEEWNTILSMVGCLFIIVLAWYIIHKNEVHLPEWIHDWGVFIITLASGYCLHRVIFKLLGTTERAVVKKIEDKEREMGL